MLEIVSIQEKNKHNILGHLMNPLIQVYALELCECYGKEGVEEKGLKKKKLYKSKRGGCCDRTRMKKRISLEFSDLIVIGR